MAGKRLGVGVIGAGRWANWAHLPGWSRDERCEVVAICDREAGRAGDEPERGEREKLAAAEAGRVLIGGRCGAVPR